MSTVQEQGSPYPGLEAGPVDAWSERIYAALRDWPVAKAGQWTRWEPGDLLLTITCVDGREVEPIQLSTADEELTVAFGCWETHEPHQDRWNAEPETIAEHAKTLVERWLKGELRTAVLTDAEGKWCGSAIIEPGELTPQLREAAQWMRDFRPTRIELRSPHKSDWQIFAVEQDWLLPPSAAPSTPR
jgi:hypothetical protein